MVGIALLLIATLHEIHAFVLIAPSTSGKIPATLSEDSLSLFQRNNGVVRSSINGLSELTMPDLPYPSSGAELTTSSFVTSSSTTLLAVPTLDPTTLLSDIFGNVLGTPLILAIPVVAALLVATLIAYGIVSYASPAEDEE
jgi:hypothetical protein